MMQKLLVVTDEHGDVVGAQIPETNKVAGRTVAQIAAGPGQTLHQMDYAVPVLKSQKDVEDFHRQLADHLQKK